MTGVHINSIAVAYPPNKYTQEQYMKAYIRNNKCDPSFVERVFKNTGIETSYSFLDEKDLFRKMDRNEYMTYIKKGLKDMAIRAVSQCVHESQMDTITHIIWGSMTGGIHAPTMDIELIDHFGMSPYTKKLNVENMGCLTGFRCLEIASMYAKESGSKVLVVVADMRSVLGNSFNQSCTDHESKSNVIVGSLFRDSCCACVVSSNGPSLYEIVNHESFTIPNTIPLVKYSDYNDHISLVISKDLPDTVCKHLPNIISTLISDYNVDTSKCDFAIHTGGPKVLNGVRDALGIKDSQMESSWYVMKNYGNLSGSSNLVVLYYNLELGKHKDVICVSMGPGVSIETLYLKKSI